ncbi:MAG: hypothetical protein WCD11_10640 [Solirubrobacteraceae bacterium]
MHPSGVENVVTVVRQGSAVGRPDTCVDLLDQVLLEHQQRGHDLPHDLDHPHLRTFGGVPDDHPPVVRKPRTSPVVAEPGIARASNILVVGGGHLERDPAPI